MANKFYTILIVPEKTSKVRKIVIPSWMLKSSALILSALILLGGVMFFDYSYVMSEIGENKQLRIENRKLRQQAQIFQSKMTTVENTLDRIKVFATRLRVIMHLEGQGANPHIQEVPLPEANTNISKSKAPNLGEEIFKKIQSASTLIPESNASLMDPEKLELLKEYDTLDSKVGQITQDAFRAEELLQDQYELLYDQRAFLAALPTLQPATGYFTSGFGVRASPYGNRIKMHEGLDIANRPGTFVHAPAAGEIVFADSKPGYGLTIIINHGYGIETWYGHLKKFIVTRGQKVKRGTKIALLGNSGRSTGPHVHYEVRVRGFPVDPLSFIFEDTAQ